jgi:hypothetical protein
MAKDLYSVVEYQYRDASNYKEFGEILLEGIFSEEDVATVYSLMYDCKQFFVPEEMGIPSLQIKLWEKYGGENEDDHDWHSIERIRLAEEQDFALPVWGTKRQFIENFQRNCEKTPDWLK